MQERFGGFALWKKIKKLRIQSEGDAKVQEEKKKFEEQRKLQKTLDKTNKMTYYKACKDRWLEKLK